jgi:hypothetical protein
VPAAAQQHLLAGLSPAKQKELLDFFAHQQQQCSLQQLQLLQQQEEGAPAAGTYTVQLPPKVPEPRFFPSYSQGQCGFSEL